MPTSKSGDQSRRALIVEPHEDARAIYRASFQMEAWHVDEADDGRIALALALATVPDVIVTEERLPGMSGLELCRVLRADPLTSDVPIVLLTSGPAPTLTRAAHACAIDAVLAKPFLPELLRSELARAIAMRQSSPRREMPNASSMAVGSGEAEHGDASETGSRRRRLTHVRAHRRQVTSQPPLEPPPLVCPECDARLTYERSHVGGVSATHGEQWDYFRCPGGCGEFQYRQRTRHLRRL